MPKIRKPPELVIREAREAVSHEILMQRTDRGLLQRDIAEVWGLKDSAASTQLRELDKLPVCRLRAIICLLGLSPGNILLWLGYTAREIKKFKEKN